MPTILFVILPVLKINNIFSKELALSFSPQNLVDNPCPLQSTTIIKFTMPKLYRWVSFRIMSKDKVVLQLFYAIMNSFLDSVEIERGIDLITVGHRHHVGRG